MKKYENQYKTNIKFTVILQGFIMDLKIDEKG